MVGRQLKTPLNKLQLAPTKLKLHSTLHKSARNKAKRKPTEIGEVTPENHHIPLEIEFRPKFKKLSHSVQDLNNEVSSNKLPLQLTNSTIKPDGPQSTSVQIHQNPTKPNPEH